MTESRTIADLIYYLQKQPPDEPILFQWLQREHLQEDGQPPISAEEWDAFCAHYQSAFAEDASRVGREIWEDRDTEWLAEHMENMKSPDIDREEAV